MLIGQITDIHLGFDRDNPDEANLARLDAVLDRLLTGPNQPDLLIMSGDLTEHGDLESMARLQARVAACPFPVWPMMGNHDARDTLLAAFPGTPTERGFVHYEVIHEDLRILLLDTFEPGRHGGAFCEARAEWLAAQLAAKPDTPTLIAMHHPPVTTGISWMDPNPQEEWIARFAEAIRGHSQIVAIACGHVHRPSFTTFHGTPLVICPSVAPRIALNLSAIDPECPDYRDLISAELPSYGLHRWNGTSLVSHFESVGNLEALARFDKDLQPMIRSLLAERP